MKILKTTGLILLVLLGLVLLAGLIAPKYMKTQRSTVIEAPPELVFNTVNDLRTWESWSPWKEVDPTMKVIMGDTVEGAGASYTWTAEEAGSGKMSILSSTPPEAIETDIVFDGMGTADAFWTFEPVNQNTRVTWGFSSRMPYPFNAMLLFTGTGAVDRDFDRGLELLKERVEAEFAEAKKYRELTVEVVDLPERRFVAIRETIDMADYSKHFEENMPKLQRALEENKVEITGMPCGLFFSWDETNQKTDMAEAVPVAEAPDLGAPFSTIILPPGKAMLVEYYGHYSGIAAAHEAIDRYMAAQGTEMGWPVIEQYVTDPTQEPDTARWLSRVFYPVE